MSDKHRIVVKKYGGKDMNSTTPGANFIDILREGAPDAVAWIRGNQQNPQLNGVVRFFETPYEGILVEAELYGLPNVRVSHSTNFYGMHIHENGNCTQPFDQTGEHYSREPELHPQHTGDMVPLLGNQGYAWTSFYNKRVTIPEIIGRSVVIHAMPDDFMTQPSGNSGMKIGCGVIH